MKQLFLIALVFLSTSLAHGQGVTVEYTQLVQKADSLYAAKEYAKSAVNYSAAFRSNGWKAYPNDRYNAACSWALSGVPDSAFVHLNKIATLSDYSNYDHITTDPDLVSLHKDERWNSLIEIVKQNKEKFEANYNWPLKAELEAIRVEDQKYRQEAVQLAEKHGWDSPEMKALWKIIGEKDSINLIKITAILDKYGWVGPDIVGVEGNGTLFLVIQHSDQLTQEKYLPMMREAVQKGNAYPAQLALLEDRVALGQGKRQTYGSQIGRDTETNVYYVQPLEDPDNVDKRRAEMGLGPLAEYVNYWQIVWDVEQYKKDLPMLEELEKRQRQHN